ncbi:MAG: DNA polymerase III subunit gamma/tau [Methylococcales symbiont of Hymedesmia sp. n. MRB-2018]|nr:MAG: DNA polymerase III subunit gamma/tau [Methylococcales symbiont of Hymedesmia sp. n. MRB-2018]
MAYQVLARKWRPQNFNQLVGQEHVSQSLANALQHDRLHHAYLFTGTRGVGKTTVARILVKAMNCENLTDSNPCDSCQVCLAFNEGRFLDLIEVDAASRSKVEETRDLLDNAQYAPHQGKYKVYLIDEVHMLSGHSFNALLKTLEEPPPHVKFLLATTDPQKIPVTVLSRCLQFNLKRLMPEQITAQMRFILEQEQIKFNVAALKLISRAADGSMRDGLSLLDQAISFGNGEVVLETVNTMLGTVAQQPVDDILLALANNNAAELLQRIEDVSQLTPDFSAILQQVLAVLHRVTITQAVPSFVDNAFDSDIIPQLSELLVTEEVQLFYQIALIGQNDLDLAPDPRSGFEMVMLRMLTFRPDNGEIPEKKNPPVVAKEKKPKIENPRQQVSTPTVKENIEPENNSQKNRREEISAINNWSVIVSKMKLRSFSLQLANNCVLISMDDNVCHLLLDSGHAQLKSTRAEEKLQKALQVYCSCPIKLKIELGKTDVMTPARKIIQKGEQRQQDAVDSINNDGNVQALKEHFDARIMPGTTESIDIKLNNTTSSEKL